MTPIHADGAADSYAKRYLLKDIFNIAIGEEDTDGVGTNGELAEKVEWISNAKDPEELMKLFKQAYAQFEAIPAALRVIVDAKNARRKEFQ